MTSTDVMSHPRPWWFRFALGYCPERCREVPQPRDPDRVLLRQVALVRNHVYLQQFADSEPAEYMHSHQWRWSIAIGLYGGYHERRMGGEWHRHRRAPYAYVMGHDVIHHVRHPTRGHTSIFIGLGRKHGVPKIYFRTGQGTAWESHIIKQVESL